MIDPNRILKYQTARHDRPQTRGSAYSEQVIPSGENVSDLARQRSELSVFQDARKLPADLDYGDCEIMREARSLIDSE
jgi:hypothetical protein